MRPQFSEYVSMLANQNPPRELYATQKNIRIHVQSTHATQSISEIYNAIKKIYIRSKKFLNYKANLTTK